MKRLCMLLLCIALTLSLLCPGAYAAENEEKEAAALNSLGLFLGTGKGFELEKSLTRAQGITLAVRALGKDKEANNGKYTCTFSDVTKQASWAKGYVAYAYKNGMTKGTSKSAFSPNSKMTDYQFLTIVLRILGYSDVNNPNFTWNKPYRLAYAVGLVDSTDADSAFTRGDAVSIFWNALKANIKGTNKTLAGYLIEQGVFTLQSYSDAVKTAEYEAGSPFEWEEPTVYIEPGDIRDPEKELPEEPQEPENPTEPEEPSEPEEPEEPEAPVVKELTWEEYQALTPSEQDAYIAQFASIDDYFAWMIKAQQEYNDKQTGIVIDTDGTIDLTT